MSEFIPFRFDVRLKRVGDPSADIAQAAFSEVSGLEAAMTVKTLKEGGRNWGEVQLAGPVTFQPIVLKRGTTAIGDLWVALHSVGYIGNTNFRMDGQIDVFPAQRFEKTEPILRYEISNALPIKYKGADLSATATAVAVEELHLAHEGFRVTHFARESA